MAHDQSEARRAPGRIGVVFGGPSPEHDVSILTGLQAARALDGAPGVDAVTGLYWSRDGGWFAVAPTLEAGAFSGGVPESATRLRLLLGPGGGFLGRRGRLSSREEPLELDALLVCCHGGPGEDGTLQSVLDLMGVAYSGPSANGAALGMDKLAFGALAAGASLPTLARVPLLAGSPEPDFPAPYIVKPRFGGSSLGIEVVADIATARARLGVNPHLAGGAVLEPYRPDLFDLQIAVRSYPELTLSAIERPLRSSTAAEILGYADKYVGGEGMVSAPRECPADIPTDLGAALRAAALAVASFADVRGVARVDFLSDGASALFVNEVNTIPGSLARYLWIDPPVPFVEQLTLLLAEARERRRSFSSVGADGSVLRGAGSIAGKLA